MQINMLEAKSQLSRLVQAALDGEEAILALARRARLAFVREG